MAEQKVINAALVLLTDGQELLSVRENWTYWANARNPAGVQVPAWLDSASRWCAQGAVMRAQASWPSLAGPEILLAIQAEKAALNALNRQASILLGDGHAVQDVNDRIGHGHDAAYRHVLECYAGAIADLRQQAAESAHTG